MPTDEEFAEIAQLLDSDELNEGPRLLATHYASPEEAVEMVRAAQVLGLGVRLHNQLRVEGTSDEGEESAIEEWIIDLLEGPEEVEDE